MSGRLQLIEQKLSNIDSAGFQHLCDGYFNLRELHINSISRTGSQFGKQKTIKGTPDTFYRTADGNLFFIEYTTQYDNLKDKLIKDIDNCLNYTKTRILPTDISKIILCFNSRLGIKDENEIIAFAKKKDIEIELIGLDQLANDILLKYQILSWEYLDLPIDTGQLLPIDSFIREYDNAGGVISTPLNNEFFHRLSELKDIETKLNNSIILIITGHAGIGKTKLSLESLQVFLGKNKDWRAFCLSNKHQDISKDLRIQIQKDKNYILFIDDANRQLTHFKQILGLLREIRTGKLKIIITVRDYVYSDIIDECLEYTYDELRLNKFSDEEIIKIIESDDFQIKNHKYQEKIITLSDGNPRLAIMAAKLALKEQLNFLYGDIYNLYDYYYRTFIKDKSIFQEKKSLSFLGLISFFYVIDVNDLELLKNLLMDFNLKIDDFYDNIEKLKILELIDEQYGHIKISEQVMATYFFYLVFIKDGILSFETLLFKYFVKLPDRFKDTIIPSTNSFGYEKVLNKINTVLNQYLESIIHREEEVIEFFSIFWFYKQTELLKFLNDKITIIPEPINPSYKTDYGTNEFVFNRNKILDFITDFFKYKTNNLSLSIELGFEFCRKMPESLPEFVRRIKENFTFCQEDIYNDFQRQVLFFKLLIEKSNEQAHYLHSLIAISGFFLNHCYHVTESHGKLKISWYTYCIPFCKNIIELRNMIWASIFFNYDNYPIEILSILKNIKFANNEFDKEILAFDLSQLLPFIKSKLNPEIFENICFVQELIKMLNKIDLADRGYQCLKSVFYSDEYKNYRVLNINFYQDKEDYEFKNLNDFRKIKEQELRNHFRFNNESEFLTLFRAINHTINNQDNIWWLSQSINIILEENISNNFDVGILLFEKIMNQYPDLAININQPIQTIIIKYKKTTKRLFSLLDSFKYLRSYELKFTFFRYLPVDYVNRFYSNEFIKTFDAIQCNYYFSFDEYQKFKIYDRNICKKILNIIVHFNENNDYKIYLHETFFENNMNEYINCLELLLKAYNQQNKLNQHFDFDRKALKSILHLRPSLLIDYIKEFYSDSNWEKRDVDNNLSFIWDFVEYEPLLNESFDLIFENEPNFSIGKLSFNIFFHGIDVKNKDKVKQFVLKFIENHYNDTRRIKAIMNVIRHNLKELFEESILLYLSLSKSLDNFIEIRWVDDMKSGWGNQIIDELWVDDWISMLDIVKKSSNKIELIPIIDYCEKQIQHYKLGAILEKRRRYIKPNN